MLSVRPGSSRVMSRIAVKLKLLRLVVGLFLALSIVCLEAFSTGQVGYSAEWKDGKSFVSAGSDPATLALATVALLIFVLVIRTKAEGNITGVPTLSRRFVAFLIDFWFSVWIVSNFAAIIPLWIEAARTGYFSWHFRRNYAVGTDEIFALPFVLASMALIFFYFVIPLTRGKQTVGCFVTRIRVTPPFGTEGVFTFRQAVQRTWCEFRGLCGFLWAGKDRDGEGRTWWDRQTSCTVVLVDYQ
jgi:uncharacterized RDD family membrane protein YckC